MRFYPRGGGGFTCGALFPFVGSAGTLTDGFFLTTGLRLPGISIGVASTDGFFLISSGLRLPGISIGVAFADGIFFTFGDGAPLRDGGDTSSGFGIC